MARRIDNEKVSNLWYPLLWDIRNVDKIPFNVNEGRRTMARQAELVREKGLFSASNPTGAAAPSPIAPHIRKGRPDHAIDFDNAAGVVAAAARRGVKLVRPISTEPWHVEIASVTNVRAYNDRRRKQVSKLRQAVRKARARVARAVAAFNRRHIPK